MSAGKRKPAGRFSYTHPEGPAAGGASKISKAAFYRAGGFSNPRLFRTMRGGSWQHFERNRI